MLEIIDHPIERGRIRELRLARPPVNALNGELLRALGAAVGAAREEAAIVITGQPGLFSAGLDVPFLLALERDALMAVFVDLWRTQRAIATSAVPVVFGLTGHSPAGGTVLAIHGDYRIMAAGEFRIGLNEVQVGLLPGSVIHGAFRRLVGGHAAQLLTRGVLMDPSTALRVGLVDELRDPDQVAARALELAREMCMLPREAMLRTRALVRKDLIDLFGNPGHALIAEREFGNTAVEMWSKTEAQEVLRKTFGKKK